MQIYLLALLTFIIFIIIAIIYFMYRKMNHLSVLLNQLLNDMVALQNQTQEIFRRSTSFPLSINPSILTNEPSYIPVYQINGMNDQQQNEENQEDVSSDSSSDSSTDSSSDSNEDIDNGEIELENLEENVVEYNPEEEEERLKREKIREEADRIIEQEIKINSSAQTVVEIENSTVTENKKLNKPKVHTIDINDDNPTSNDTYINENISNNLENITTNVTEIELPKVEERIVHIEETVKSKGGRGRSKKANVIAAMEM